MRAQFLIVPGLGGSGPDHWQSRWERAFPGARRVEQLDWNRPILPLWLEQLAAAVSSTPGAILVGHSLGCALIAHLAGRRPELRIGGALLVAPADVDRAGRVLPQVDDFAPMPTGKLPFRTVVVASMNDPYMTIERARFLANAWGAGLVNAAPADTSIWRRGSVHGRRASGSSMNWSVNAIRTRGSTRQIARTLSPITAPRRAGWTQDIDQPDRHAKRPAVADQRLRNISSRRPCPTGR
jgi:uncharacterized protein